MVNGAQFYWRYFFRLIFPWVPSGPLSPSYPALFFVTLVSQQALEKHAETPELLSSEKDRILRKQLRFNDLFRLVTSVTIRKRRVRNAEVRGSIPLGSTKTSNIYQIQNRRTSRGE